MAVITPTTINNRLGRVVSNPAATTNTGPVAGDIGATPTKKVTPSHMRRSFDVTLTAANGGDTVEFTIPTKMRKGIGMQVTVIPQNATARTGNPFMTQTATTVTLTFAAAAAAAQYAITFDSMHSIGR